MNVVIDRKPHRSNPALTEQSLTEQIDKIKNTLYRKIDICFMKYGLRGLKKIDESVAEGLKYFIAEEEGVDPSSLGTTSRQPTRNENFDDDPMALAGEMDTSWEKQPIDNGMSNRATQVTESAQTEFTDPAFALAAEMEASPNEATQNNMNENTNTEGN